MASRQPLPSRHKAPIQRQHGGVWPQGQRARLRPDPGQDATVSLRIHRELLLWCSPASQRLRVKQSPLAPPPPPHVPQPERGTLSLSMARAQRFPTGFIGEARAPLGIPKLNPLPATFWPPEPPPSPATVRSGGSVGFQTRYEKALKTCGGGLCQLAINTVARRTAGALQNRQHPTRGLKYR